MSDPNRINTSCPGCGKRFALSINWAGKGVQCKKCATHFIVPHKIGGAFEPAERAIGPEDQTMPGGRAVTPMQRPKPVPNPNPPKPPKKKIAPDPDELDIGKLFEGELDPNDTSVEKALAAEDRGSSMTLPPLDLEGDDEAGDSGMPMEPLMDDDDDGIPMEPLLDDDDDAGDSGIPMEPLLEEDDEVDFASASKSGFGGSLLDDEAPAEDKPAKSNSNVAKKVCDACGSLVPTTADICPNCGYNFITGEDPFDDMDI